MWFVCCVNELSVVGDFLCFFSSRRRHTRCALVTGVQTCALPIFRSITPDPVLLFRYSALTFNAHRIHYDRDYARDVEGYAGLVVHGPLIATLLMDHAQRAAPDIVPRHFAFRAEAPLIDGEIGRAHV